MAKRPTTIRIDEDLYAKVLRAARKAGLSVTDILHLLLRGYVEGNVHVGVTQYPKHFIRALERESEELSRLYRTGKIKSYKGGGEFLDDILGR